MSKFSEGVECAAVFLDFDVFIPLPLVASIFTAQLYAIFLALPHISFHDSNNYVIYFDSRSALQTLGRLYACILLVLKIQCFLMIFRPVETFSLSAGSLPTLGSLATKKLMFWSKVKRTIPLPSANHNALPLQDYVPSIRRSIRASWKSRWDQFVADGNKLGSVETFPWSMFFLSPAV